MTPSVHGPEAAEYFFAEGCYITELHNRADDPLLSVARARLPAGASTRWHRLRDTSERYLVLQGEGRVQLGEAFTHTVRAGDSVLIPPGCAQRIHNTGNGDLVFLALCTPRFTPAAYDDLEDATP